MNLSIEQIASIVSKSIKEKIIDAEKDTAVIFYNINLLENNARTIANCFPKNAMHTVAVKANPLVNILKKFIPLGFGVEVASLPELYLAINIGFSPKKIVFDSPIKTREEIKYALNVGVHININSLEELERVAILKKNIKSKSTIGLRINPQVGGGKIKATSVATKISKFGVPIKTNREKIINYFLKYTWLTGLHVHIGSQGISPNLLGKGIKKIVELAEEINQLTISKQGKQRIDFLDIGGGFPVTYNLKENVISFKKFKKKLENKIPNLFKSKYKIISEYGRYIHANAGWAVSRVEYVVIEKEYNIITTHLGADFLLRKAYNPEDWHHHISVLDKNGNQKKTNKKKKYKIAGPLCFSGDFIADDVMLPEVEVGDNIIIHDVGAYTLSMWSKYNSRQIPKVIAYTNKEFEIIKERESINETIKFWNK